MNIAARKDPAAAAAPPGAMLGRIGALCVRIAATPAEIDAAQALRYQVFVGEFGADLNGTAERDIDRFDPLCDHLIVIDTGLPGPDARRIVGTYRLLRQDRLDDADGFYSDATFDLAGLVARHPERHFVEMGRSCVLPAYRGRRALELLWQGIWAYCRLHALDVMVGCASFAGTDAGPHRQALSLLYHHARADADWAVDARPGHAIAFDPMPAEAIDLRAAMRALPPLIKGYLRLGARFGTGAVVDAAFASIDVLVVLPIEQINPRYLAHYGAEADRFAT